MIQPTASRTGTRAAGPPDAMRKDPVMFPEKLPEERRRALPGLTRPLSLHKKKISLPSLPSLVPTLLT